MEIQFNTDKNIEGKERLENYVKELISKSLKRFDDYITRIEVHLSDENAHKEGANDKKCVLEARPTGMKPVAVTCQESTIEKAINGGIDKMKASLDTIIGRLQNH
ncbi:MAG: HPF/RaiA family ribosome-associated protein [Brumimicrobium sp.]